MARDVTVEIVRLLDANKAIAAFFAPFVLTVLTVLASWIESGVFNSGEIRTAVAGLFLSAAAALATWVTKAGTAVIKTPVQT